MFHLRSSRFVTHIEVTFRDLKSRRFFAGSDETSKPDALPRHSEAEEPSETIPERVIQVDRVSPQFDSFSCHPTQLDGSISVLKVTATDDLQLSDVEEQHKLPTSESHCEPQWNCLEPECQRCHCQQSSAEESGVLVRPRRIEHQSAFHVPATLQQHHSESVRDCVGCHVARTQLSSYEHHKCVRGECELFSFKNSSR